MKRFAQFQIHEYMDEFPRTTLMVFEGTTENEIVDKCYAYAEHMNANYSGGSTTFKGILDQKDAEKHILNKIAEEATKYADNQSISNIKSMCDMFMEVYH